jgi:hypothetical protein
MRTLLSRESFYLPQAMRDVRDKCASSGALAPALSNNQLPGLKR